MRGTTISLPGRIRPASKTALKRYKKQMIKYAYWYNSMLYKFLNPNYAWHNDFTTRSNSTGLKNSFKTAQKTNVEPGMATYCYNSMLYKFLNPNYVWHNDFTTRSNSTGLKNSYKTAQKTNVEPDVATYWFNSVIYMYFITNST